MRPVLPQTQSIPQSTAPRRLIPDSKRGWRREPCLQLSKAGPLPTSRPFSKTALRRATSGYQRGDGSHGSSRRQDSSATGRLRETYEEVGDRFRRTAANVDSKFDLSGKAHKAATRVQEQARAVESKFGVQHRLRSWSDDFRRQLPQWGRKYSQFSRTPFGQVATTAFVVYLFASGVAFKLLNILFILWWLLPIIALPLARRRNQQAQAARQQRQRTSANLAEELLRQMRSGQGFNARNPSWQSPSSSKRRDYSNMGDGGPIIDAEWTTVDEDK